ncbi:MAG: M14 family metallopeptidase, partial [Myxococcota bacterium]
HIRPGVWIDGNMHAVELTGSSVALAIAEDVLRLHLGAGQPTVPAAIADRLRQVLFYVLPRMSPDGAECVLTTGRIIRSVPRDDRPNRNQPRWRGGDVDGDGLALKMRVRDPAGDFVESTEFPGLMLARRIEDTGPFYRVFPEGFIDNYDGFTVPPPSMLTDTQTDLNRNFPFFWAPAHQQVGAGAFPGSEPESRAVLEFASRRPHIFAWLNLHTFGGVLIRPRGDQPDSRMDPADLALFRQIGAWSEEFTNYPTVSGFEDFTYQPDKPLHGDLSDYAYHQRGCIGYVVELWDLFTQIGITRPFKRFVDRYTQLTRDEIITMARWDRDHNQSRVVRPWRACTHPQLGAVEVGGLDPRIGLWNAPPERLGELCAQHSAAFLRVAALAPQLTVTTTVHTTGDSSRITAVINNLGYLPTYILSSARNLDFCEPLWAELSTVGCTLDDQAGARREIGHLDGWGRGLGGGSDALYYQASRGNSNARRLSFTVRGSGRVTLRVGSCRTGWVASEVSIPGRAG